MIIGTSYLLYLKAKPVKTFDFSLPTILYDGLGPPVSYDPDTLIQGSWMWKWFNLRGHSENTSTRRGAGEGVLEKVMLVDRGGGGGWPKADRHDGVVFLKYSQISILKKFDFKNKLHYFLLFTGKYYTFRYLGLTSKKNASNSSVFFLSNIMHKWCQLREVGVS